MRQCAAHPSPQPLCLRQAERFKWSDCEEYAASVRTCANPSLDISDLETIADLAHDNGLPLIVDDTFTTAYLQRPFDHGVDVVCTSLTKWTGGHGTAIGGAIIDGGSFDWSVAPPFPRALQSPSACKA